MAALKRAADAVGAVTRGYSGSYAAAPQGTNKKFYGDQNPIGQPSFEEKVKVLQDIDAYLRGKDDKVRQVTASVAASWQVVDILRADGHRVRDIRPMTRINISVMPSTASPPISIAPTRRAPSPPSICWRGKTASSRRISSANW